jgi:hypothetical protein
MSPFEDILLFLVYKDKNMEKEFVESMQRKYFHTVKSKGIENFNTSLMPEYISKIVGNESYGRLFNKSKFNNLEKVFKYVFDLIKEDNSLNSNFGYLNSAYL